MTIYIYAQGGVNLPGGASQDWKAYKRTGPGSWSVATLSGCSGFGRSYGASSVYRGREFAYDQSYVMRGIVAPPSFASVPILQLAENYAQNATRQVFVDAISEEMITVGSSSPMDATVATCIDVTRPSRWVLSLNPAGSFYQIDMQEKVRKEPPDVGDYDVSYGYYAHTGFTAFSNTNLNLTHTTESLVGTYPRIEPMLAQAFYFGGYLWSVCTVGWLFLSDDSSVAYNGMVQGSSALIRSCVANPSLVDYDFSIFGSGSLRKIFWHEDSFAANVDRRFGGAYGFTCPFLWNGHVVLPFRVTGHWYDTTSAYPYSDEQTHESTNKHYIYLLDPSGNLHTMNAQLTWNSLPGAVDAYLSGCVMLDSGEIYRWHCELDGYSHKSIPAVRPTTARLRLYHLTSYDLGTYSFTWTELDHLDIPFNCIASSMTSASFALMVTWDGSDILVRPCADSSQQKTDVVHVFDTGSETWGTEYLPEASLSVWWFKPLTDTLSAGGSYSRLIGKGI